MESLLQIAGMRYPFSQMSGFVPGRQNPLSVTAAIVLLYIKNPSVSRKNKNK